VQLIADDELVTRDIDERAVVLVKFGNKGKCVGEIIERKRVVCVDRGEGGMFEKDAVVEDADKVAAVDLHGTV